ncbi:MAG: hypothetical protein NPIRA02_31770 [Nitrospirales bacterium]|nr:MAG: hypothetical protein NPIRA02_31770 [Nitrospirales bacterium]
MVRADAKFAETMEQIPTVIRTCAALDFYDIAVGQHHRVESRGLNIRTDLCLGMSV